MADNQKTGPNLQTGAGFLAKRVQKSLNRAQEKVLQKLGKTMETKDEQFEQCSQNLIKQQADGVRLTKDVRAYFTAVKAIHESSKRLSQTLKDVYESEWSGGEDLSDIIEKEDLMWNDYEEKVSDQIVRTMENYTSQFPEVKERVGKRGRKLVDYDSARHHLEALQGAKKKDDGKMAKAEDEFNKAQNVFEELNKELREELPVLYQSRIGCYVTVFQNISNLRDVFYKEMSLLNHELYNVMKKLETQHSGKAFIIKGLNSSSSKSKKRKSLIISNPIPCNTAFPVDHVSQRRTGPEPLPSDDAAGSASKDSASSSASELDDLGSEGSDTPKRQLACDGESSDCTAAERPELSSSQSDDSGVGGPMPEGAGQDVAPPLPPVREAKAKAPPVPTPRSKAGAEAEKVEAESGKEEVEAEKVEAETGKEEVEAEKVEAETGKDEVEAEKVEAETGKEEAEAEKVEVEAENVEAETGKEEVEAEKVEVEAEKVEVEAEKEEEKVEAETGKEEVEAEKVEAEKVEAEKTEAEKAEAEKAEAEKVKAEAEKAEAEKAEAEKAEAEKAEAEKAEAEKAEAEKVKAEAEKAEAEKAEAEKVKAEAEKAEAEKAEAEKAEAEKAEAEKLKAEAEKAEAEKAEAEKVKAEAEKVEAETKASEKDSPQGGAAESQASSEEGTLP